VADQEQVEGLGVAVAAVADLVAAAPAVDPEVADPVVVVPVEADLAVEGLEAVALEEAGPEEEVAVAAVAGNIQR
jgi:hypothetical protein